MKHHHHASFFVVQCGVECTEPDRPVCDKADCTHKGHHARPSEEIFDSYPTEATNG